MNENFFHLVFVFVFVAFTGIRAYYHKLAAQTQGKVEYKEGWLHTALRLVFGIPFMLMLLVYMVRPGILAWAKLPLPSWLQWIGFVMGIASIPLIWRVQRSLGSNFSTTLHLREEHTVVTSGPYRWVRHPMYTVLYIHLIAVFLLTGNWLIGGFFSGCPDPDRRLANSKRRGYNDQQIWGAVSGIHGTDRPISAATGARDLR